MKADSTVKLRQAQSDGSVPCCAKACYVHHADKIFTTISMQSLSQFLVLACIMCIVHHLKSSSTPSR